jgi:hypothetical protein
VATWCYHGFTFRTDTLTHPNWFSCPASAPCPVVPTPSAHALLSQLLHCGPPAPAHQALELMSPCSRNLGLTTRPHVLLCIEINNNYILINISILIYMTYKKGSKLSTGSTNNNERLLWFLRNSPNKKIFIDYMMFS